MPLAPVEGTVEDRFLIRGRHGNYTPALGKRCAMYSQLEGYIENYLIK
jgi:hypothetical protein